MRNCVNYVTATIEEKEKKKQHNHRNKEKQVWRLRENLAKKKQKVFSSPIFFIEVLICEHKLCIREK